MIQEHNYLHLKQNLYLKETVSGFIVGTQVLSAI